MHAGVAIVGRRRCFPNAVVSCRVMWDRRGKADSPATSELGEEVNSWLRRSGAPISEDQVRRMSYELGFLHLAAEVALLPGGRDVPALPPSWRVLRQQVVTVSSAVRSFFSVH